MHRIERAFRCYDLERAFRRCGQLDLAALMELCGDILLKGDGK